MFWKSRTPLCLLLTATLAASAFGQLVDSAPPPFQEGVYRITKIIVESNILGAENLETKVYFSAAFTYDPVPKAVLFLEDLKQGKNGKNGKTGKNGRKSKKAKKPQPEEAPPKVTHSKDCKGWMIHVNWAPRVGDKVKLADVGGCHLKGSFAGR